VALSLNGITVAEQTLTSDNYVHSEKLNAFIEHVMATANWSYSDLNAVAVSKGPGSYTGLRIGTATAKGLCYALDIPLIGISTLEAIAAGYLASHPDVEGVLCPMIDARRMEVYTAMYSTDLEELEKVSAQVVETDTFSASLKKGAVHFIGDGAAKCADTLQHPNAHFPESGIVSATAMVLLATKRLAANTVEDLAYFEPAYFKEFVAGKPKNLLA